MKLLRQSTASQEIPLGPFVDSADGNTEETGLTIANTDILLHKAGATTLASKNSGGATHISNGIYYAVLDDTDTNTLGVLTIHVHVAGALAFRDAYSVVPANVYDSIIAGTDSLKARLSTPGTRTVTIHTQEADTTVIPTATVTLYSDSGRTTQYSRVTTDANGDAELGLDDGTYYWSATAAGYTFTSSSFTVSANGTQNVTGVEVSTTSPSAGDLCVVFGTLRNASGTADAGATVSAYAVTSAKDGNNNVMVNDVVSATTDANGYFELELIQGISVVFEISVAGISKTSTSPLTVPAQASYDVSNLV